MEEMNVNWAAYATAVVAQMIIGYLWFHPAVMGNIWAKANGSTLDELKPKNMGMTMGLTIVYTLIFTFWMMMNVTGPGQEDVKYHAFQHGVAHAVLLSIMVMLPVFGTPALYEKRSWSWTLCHVGYWFVRMAVAGGILSLWR